jgi:hypothetical protein
VTGAYCPRWQPAGGNAVTSASIWASIARLGAVLSNDMIEGLLPGFAHSVFFELGEVCQKLLQELSAEGATRLESVDDVSAVAWLDAVLIASNCHLGYGDVVCALRYQLGACTASMQDRPLTCECGKPFSPGQAMWCRCCARMHTNCHDVAVAAVGVCVLRDLHRPGLGRRLMLTCRAMLFWIPH